MNKEELSLALLLLFILIGVSLYLLRKYFFHSSIKPKRSKIDDKTKINKEKTPCLLCRSILGKGENLKSDEYKGDGESIVHVFGCPNCYGKTAVKNRICPICKKKIPPDGYLMGKMWNENDKQRLHIVSCTECRGSR